MLKWLNAFAFCFWEHENKSWIRDSETELILTLLFYLHIYKCERKWNASKGSASFKASKTSSSIWFAPFHLAPFSNRTQLFLHSCSYCLWKAWWPKLGDSFSLPHLPWGGPIFDAKKQDLLPVFQQHPGCHPSLLNVPFLHSIHEMSSGHILKRCWLRPSFRSIHTILETITSTRPEPESDQLSSKEVKSLYFTSCRVKTDLSDSRR